MNPLRNGARSRATTLRDANQLQYNPARELSAFFLKHGKAPGEVVNIGDASPVA
jgi:hypothetical protein